MASLHTLTQLQGYLTTSNSTFTNIINYESNADSTISVNARLVGRKVSNGHVISAQFSAVVRRSDAGTIMVSSVLDILSPVKDLDMLLTDYDIGLTNNNIDIKVKGLNSSDVDWFCVVDLLIN